jgi:hypothetical protein
MYDDDRTLLVQDPVTGDYRRLAIPEHAPTRIRISCPRCEYEFVGSIFKAARDGFPDHRCKPNRRRLHIW